METTSEANQNPLRKNEAAGYAAEIEHLTASLRNLDQIEARLGENLAIINDAWKAIMGRLRVLLDIEVS